MTLYIMGMGLRGYRSLTVDEIEQLKRCDNIFLEMYTSGSMIDDIQRISRELKKNIQQVYREDVEQSDVIIKAAQRSETALLVIGDALTATTHNQIRFELEDLGIPVLIYENASIVTAIMGYLGLHLYNLGPVISLPFVSEKFFPKSPYEKLVRNITNQEHSLILLDLSPSGYMKPSDAIHILQDMNEKFGKKIDLERTRLCVVNAFGMPEQKIFVGNPVSAEKETFSDKPSAIVFPGRLDSSEQDSLRRLSVSSDY
ncbi:MAG: diphthine synthase [Candidatus Thermoplasmatota archaeon]|nr:diphthine synthase [Candidatus Thermoplasmatota archaeon]